LEKEGKQISREIFVKNTLLETCMENPQIDHIEIKKPPGGEAFIFILLRFDHRKLSIAYPVHQVVPEHNQQMSFHMKRVRW